MTIYNNSFYREQLRDIAENLSIDKGCILVTGATGLIGSCVIDVLIYANDNLGTCFDIYALGRNEEKLYSRFSYSEQEVHYIVQDITDNIDKHYEFDYIIHGASNADPKSYALYPFETILTNVLGTNSVLDYCKAHVDTRVLLMSTFEVYGLIEKDKYTEDDFGKIDYNLIRSGYPESKRTAELMLRSFCDEYNGNAVIARLSSIYGPTMLENDSKAHAQFIRNGLSNKDIVLKSEGKPIRTYCYVMDAVSALFHVLINGKKGEAYNIANSKSVASIAEVANKVAELCNVNISFDLPDAIEAKGFSKPQNCILGTDKIESTGWKGKYDLHSGIDSTIKILKGMND